MFEFREFGDKCLACNQDTERSAQTQSPGATVRNVFIQYKAFLDTGFA